MDEHRTNAGQIADEGAPLTDVGAPAQEREQRLPQDAFRREDYRGDVSGAVAKLRGVTHADGNAPLETTAPTAEDGQPRDENGRFARKPGDAPESAASPEGTSAPEGTQQEATPAEAPKPAGAPPPGWSAESKAKFAELPPCVLEDIAKREREVSDGFRQMSQAVKAWAQVDEALAPRRQFLAGKGFQSDAQVVNHLLSYSDSMERNPAGTLKVLADAYGIDLARLAGAPAQGGTGEPEYVSPELAELRQQNAAMVQRIQQIEGTFVAHQRAAEQSAAESIAQEIRQFAEGKPHFEKVRPIMGALMQSGAAGNMDVAYQMACYADPEVRAQMQKEADDRQRSEVEAKRKEAVARQKSAAVQVRGAPGGAATAPKPAPKPLRGDDVRQDIKADVAAAMRQLSNSA